jgi:NAD(P) transhydrogenase subunit alpha
LIPDALFTDAGATIGDPWGADVVVKSRRRPPTGGQAATRARCWSASWRRARRRSPAGDRQGGRDRVCDGGDPRLSRAQSMDALVQANVGGYKAALLKPSTRRATRC